MNSIYECGIAAIRGGRLFFSAPQGATIVACPLLPMFHGDKVKNIALLSLLLSCHVMANESPCDDAIIEQFHKARELYLSIQGIHAEGYQNPKIAAWKSETDRLREKCDSISDIDLPFDRAIGTHNLYDLMEAYINGKGVEEWQTKFSLALICHENPNACSKYINKTSPKEIEDFLKSN